MAFKMGVSPSTPIKNNSFREGTYKKLTLSAAYTAGGTTLTFVAPTPAINQILRAGDIIQIGPSTNATYIGQSEYAVVTNTNTTTITISGSSLSCSYASGDTVTFIGTKLAGGWDVSDTTGTTVVEPLYITCFSNVVGANRFEGMSDNFMQYITLKATYASIYQSLGDVLIPSAYYRLGTFLNSASFTGGTPNINDKIYLRLNDGTSSVIINYSMLNGTQSAITAWTEFSSVAQMSSTVSNCIISVIHNKSGATSASFKIDDIYLEHAIDTDDYTSGVYTFDDDPDFESVNFTPIQTYETLELSNNNRVRFDPTGTGRGIIKYETTAEFTNAPKALYNNLMKLLAWQNAGHLLVFHPGGNYTVDSSPYIQRTGQMVNPVMYGFMEITPKSSGMWDRLNYISFSFKFTEA